MAIGRFNLGGKAATGGLPFPLYQQMNEPVKKEGLWIKTLDKIKDVYVGNTTETMTQEWVKSLDLPTEVKEIDATGVIVNDDIYFFRRNKTVYKFNLTNETYTKIENIPVSSTSNIFSISASAVNTDIYIFVYDASNSYSEIYKYDTLTNQYERKSNSPTNVFISSGDSVTIGTSIYMLLGTGGTTHQEIYEYDTITGNFSLVGDSIINLNNARAVTIGTDIYFQKDRNLYKFNTATGSCERIGTHPRSDNQYSAIAAVDNTIFIFGGYAGASTYRNYLFSYNIITGLYTSLDVMPFNGGHMLALTKDKNIYILGGEPDSINKNLYKFKTEFQYTPGIYLYLNVTDYKDLGGWLLKELYKNITNVQIFNETEKLEYPVYIGDGTSWNSVGGGVAALKNKLKEFATSIFNMIIPKAVLSWH